MRTTFDFSLTANKKQGGFPQGNTSDFTQARGRAMHLFLGILMLGLAGISMPAMAFTDSEIKAMPPYCWARMYKDPGKVEYWKGVLGPEYEHVHHYCYAIGFINRYYGSHRDKYWESTLTDAMGNLDYVFRAFSPTHSLMPEVHMNRGLVYSLQKNDGKAIIDIRKAIEMNPKLVRAYSMAADIYVKLKKKDEALKVVTAGLRHNPESTALQRRYKSLGGQLPYPEPVAQKGAAPEETTPSKNTPQTDTQVDKAAVTDVQIPASAVNDAAKKEGEHAVATPAPTPKIGSPSNPWCRFCPDEPNQ
jgi:tetratricopeptide (TPR) repeat protein